jgi:uncharacterized protein
MHDQLFVNLPVADLPRSKAFFEAMGYRFEPRFTNESGACLVLGDRLFAMLLTRPFFQGFTPKAIADATQTSEVLNALSCRSRAEVDALVARALAAGGTVARPPQDLGFMYSQAYEDLDGHIWELFCMDMAAAEAAMGGGPTGA